MENLLIYLLISYEIKHENFEMHTRLYYLHKHYTIITLTNDKKQIIQTYTLNY